MLNMDLAIIMDNYEEVTQQAGAGETLWQEAFQLWRRWNGVRRGTYVPLEQVLIAVNAEKHRASMLRGKSQDVGGALGAMQKKTQRATQFLGRHTTKFMAAIKGSSDEHEAAED